MNDIKNFLIIGILLFALPGQKMISQPRQWTLEECIAYAKENNLQVKEQALDVQIANSNYEATKAEIYPSLNGAVEQNFSFGRSVDPYSYTFTEDNVISNNFYVYTSVDVFNGFKHWKKRDRDYFNLMADKALVEYVKNDISLSITLAYMQILLDNKLLKITEKQVGITKQQEEKTQKLFDAGALAKGDLLEIKSQLAQEQLDVVKKKNNLDLSYLDLIQFLELDSVSGFSIVFPEVEEPYALPGMQMTDSALSYSLDQLPEIQASKYMISSYEKDLEVTKCGGYPSLSLSGSVYTGYSNARVLFDEQGGEIMYPFPDQFKDNAYRSVGLNLNIPIFNKFSVKYALETSKVQVLKAKNRLEQQKNEVRKKIQEAYANAVAAYKKYNASKVSLTTAKEAFKYAEQKFNLGIISSVEYNASKNKLAKAESELAQAKYEYAFRKSILAFYTGQPLTLQ